MLEVTFVAFIIVIALAGSFEAFLRYRWQTGHSSQDTALIAAANNIIVDLRAATMYDPTPAFVGGAGGATHAFTLPVVAGTPRPVACTTAIASSAGGGPIATATVTCTDNPAKPGIQGDARGTIGYQAPAPGEQLTAQPPPGNAP